MSVDLANSCARPLAAGLRPISRPDVSGRFEFDHRRPRSPKALVLGLGNDILCDDAVGLLVAREIRRRLEPGDDSQKPSEPVDVLETCEMGLALLDYIVGYEELVLVDSIQTHRAPPGFVHELDGKDIKALPVTTPHFLGIGEMIMLGRQLGLPVPQRVKIFAIEVQDPFTISTELTPALQQALPAIVSRVLKNIAE